MYDAVTQRRPYQRALSSAAAVALLRQQVACGWRERTIVETFAGIIGLGQLETFAGNAPLSLDDCSVRP
jgi:HD-GYP domain-containing protein (c-di-GMP phosphodiesterase class II)